MNANAYTPVWQQAMDEWGDGPRTMSSTAAWANRWFHKLRTDHERLMITLAARDAELAALRERACEWFNEDGTTTKLEPEQVIERRKAAAKDLASLRLRYREAVTALSDSTNTYIQTDVRRWRDFEVEAHRILSTPEAQAALKEASDASRSQEGQS